MTAPDSESSATRSTSPRLAIKLVVAALLGLMMFCGGTVVLVVVAARVWLMPRTPSTPTAAQVTRFGERAGIVLPPAATPIAYLETLGMDDSLWLQLKMAPGDLQTFLKSPPLDGLNLRTEDKFGVFLDTLDQFWTVPPKTYRSGQLELPNARALNVLIDESDSENPIVYLNWHET